MIPVSVIVPVRNAAAWVGSCLASIRAAEPAELIVVDGSSTDGTPEIAAAWADLVVDDEGAGVAAARQLGVSLAANEWVLLVDVDVVLPAGAIEGLLAEAIERRLEGIQAALRSVGEGDYWSEALAEHHNRGLVKGWFGVCATLVRRDLLLRHPLDARFRSGEDVDLRLRLEAAGEAIGVSERVVVLHRFAGGWDYSRDQFLADGAGLGRLVRRHGWAAVPRALLPFGAAAVGVLRVLAGQGRLIPYWVALAAYNLRGLLEGLVDDAVDPIERRRHTPATGVRERKPAELGQVSVRAVVGLILTSAAGLVGAIALIATGTLPSVGDALERSPLPGLLTASVAAVLVVAELTGMTQERRPPGPARLALDLALGAAGLAIVIGGVRFAYLVGLLA